MYNLSNFIQLLKDYISLFDALVEVEQEKLLAAKKNRVTFVEEAMKKEQVYILQLKGYDKKREQIQQELGFSSLSFQQILEQVSKEENDQLTPLFYQFQEKVALLQEVSENAKKMIELNLHTIEKALKQEKADSASSQKPIGSFHSRKI
ncbi:MAG: flagellar export chaperone FlgN [Firmicutes bacterium]|uniref:Flagellar export chaperone FlgN n=1 Tax=Candidatus Scybalomonas excrementavium TaxID=2840943 RepID=A0A9D9I222_9FIRM|nr:flagellar export chaperone FlgN [Candidatus Scybalomonas excrementavium]